MHFLRRVWAYIVSLPRLYSIGGASIALVLVVVVMHVATGAPADATLPPALSHVTVASVGGLSSTSGPLPVTGKVTSLNQANILAQSSGEITTLQVHLGSQVGAGQILATFENSSQAAAVQQAEGAYEAATAALAKATGSTAANAGLTSSQAASSAANSATAAQTAMQSVFAAVDDAVHTKADVMFSNPRSITPQFLLTIPDNQLSITLQNQRAQIEATIADASKHAADTTNTNIDANSTAISLDGQTVITFLNNLVAAANQAVSSQSVSPATLATYQASAGAARSEVVSALSALSSAKNAYDAAQSGAQSAANSATTGSINDIAASQANVKQALGALNAARANLEKTIVRSPISGTVVSLPVSRGDFVSSFAQVAVVSNPGALEIQTNVTPNDAKTLVVGGKATIGANNIAGVITAIAPALDPTTGKIQVKVGILGNVASITDGDTVNVLLVRTTATGTGTTANTASSAAISIPIAAAKITPNGAVVFTVASSTLTAHAITLGAVQGDQVAVTSGLTPDMDIVTDARGLTDGQQVVVDTQ
jgi:multidrug efflux pump subunit AcrA (membrane-fusion protein)